MSDADPKPSPVPPANALVLHGDKQSLMLYPDATGVGLSVRLEWWPDGAVRWRYTTIPHANLEEVEAFIRQTRLTMTPRHGHAECSFCGKNNDDVKKLIAGPNRTYICDECIALCAGIVADDISVTGK